MGTSAPHDVSTRRDLARALTALRERAKLTIRDLARESGVPSATIGGYCSGRHVPSLTHLDPFLAVLGVLGERDPAPWVSAVERIWWAASNRPVDARSPYKGLEGYGAHDAEWFFGRHDLTSEILALVRDRAVSGGTIAVVGASGSGKSSLLRAGVLAAVDSGVLGGGWASVVTTPGRDPLVRLHRALAELREGASAVVVIDQVEELFTERIEPRERDAFVARLRDLGERRVVVLGMRADFYAVATREPNLVPLLQNTQIVVGPLSEENLRAAIVEPARIAGVELDSEFITRVMGDLKSGDRLARAHDIGALPLLSHALRMTWETAAGAVPTVTHYESIGGIAGAIARSAEEVYRGLDTEAQTLARRMLLRLLNDDGELLTRRSVPWSELIDPDQEDPRASEVIEAFVAARLLTADAESVRVAHEALLTSWPMIGEWIAVDRAGLHLHRQISDASTEWEDSMHDTAMLWRGGRLESAQELLARDDHGGLNRRERAFIDASTQAAASEVSLAKRRSRRLVHMSTLMAVLAAVAVMLAGLAVTGQRSAQTARDEALSRQIAINANILADSDPALAQQLALAGYQIAETVEARSALLDIGSRAAVTRFAVPIGPASVAVSADGRLIATGNVDGHLRLFAQDGAEVRQLAELEIDPANQMYGVALSADGTLAAIGGTGTIVRLVDTSDPEHPILLPQELDGPGIEALTFSPDGSLLVGSSKFHTAYRWSITSGVATDLGELTGFGGPLHMAAFSPDSTRLATASNDGVLRVWDAAAVGATDGPLALLDLGAVSNHVLGVSFSPDGTVLAAGTRDGHVRLLDVGESSLTPRGEPFADFTGPVNAVAFGSGGDEVVAGSSDRTVRVFLTATGSEIDRMPNTTPITSLAYLGESREVLVGAPDGYIRAWRRAEALPPTSELTIGDLGLSSDGRVLAVAQRSALAGSVSIWNAADPYRPVRGPRDATSEKVLLNGSVALSNDGTLLAAGSTTGEVVLFRLAGGMPREIAQVSAATVTVQHVAFDRTGDLMAVATDDALLSLWNVRDPTAPQLIDTQQHARDRLLGAAFHPEGTVLAVSSADAVVYIYRLSPTGMELIAEIVDPENFVHTVAFSPGGTMLAVGSADRRVRLYDMADPALPELWGEPLRGPTGYVYEVSFTANGSHLAAAADGVVWVWELADGKQPSLTGALRAAAGSVNAVRISPVDDAVIAGGSDARLLLWDPHPERVAERLCALSGTAITEDEWSQYVAGAAYAPSCPM